jgi:uncharacterized protein
VVLGTWAGKRGTERMPARRFRQFVGVLLAVIAVQMIVTG